MAAAAGTAAVADFDDICFVVGRIAAATSIAFLADMDIVAAASKKKREK